MRTWWFGMMRRLVRRRRLVWRRRLVRKRRLVRRRRLVGGGGGAWGSTCAG
jgi:hypothetical protein